METIIPPPPIYEHNVKIGTNTVATKDVPDNCTVVGFPVKILTK